MTALAVFVLTYLGIAFGRLPGLAIDRTGIAMLGAIAMVVSGVMTTAEAFHAVDIPTILLLYSLMVISAQLRLGGFYAWSAGRIIPLLGRPRLFLGASMLLAAGLSALLANDIVCLAFTPVLIHGLLAARLNPMPFLIGLAVASNIGSAATIIGNPQNMLIGQTARLDFAAFVSWCLPPSALALVAGYLLLVCQYRRHFVAGPESETAHPDRRAVWPVFNRQQTAKGLVAITVLIGLFFTPVPREVSAIGLAGLLLCSRSNDTRRILGLVDWHLITLFCALFIVVHGISQGDLPTRLLEYPAGCGRASRPSPDPHRGLRLAEQYLQQCPGRDAAHRVSRPRRPPAVVCPGALQHLCRQLHPHRLDRQSHRGRTGGDRRGCCLLQGPCQDRHPHHPLQSADPGGLDRDPWLNRTPLTPKHGDLMHEIGLNLEKHIRTIPDWPKKGVMFRDISSLLEDRLVFRKLVDLFVHRYFTTAIDAVVGIDARGFIIGAPLAYELNAGFIPVRKKGKLPGRTISEAYALEYGEAEVEIQIDWLQPGYQVILVDDLIATGGTMLAAATLLKRLGVEIVEAAAIIDLPDLGGSSRLRDAGLAVHTFCAFAGE